MISDLLDCSTPEREYWSHVSSQDELPLAAALWRERTLEDLGDFVDDLQNSDLAPAVLTGVVASALIERPSLLSEFRLVCALSDKRTYLDLSYIFSRAENPDSPGRTMCGCPPHELTRHPTSFFERILTTGNRHLRTGLTARDERAAILIATYLLEKGLGTVLALYGAQDRDGRLAVLEKWLLPKEMQQNEAKRRGHGAEASVAAVLKASGCPIFPPEKDVNPMGAYDPNISLSSLEIVPRLAGETFSCDIALLEEKFPRVAIMGLVQSSDPGQFGVNKSDEVVQLRRVIDEFNEHGDRQLELWGLVDGVGYSENKNGTVNKMLRNFHYFVQQKTVYKAPLRAHALGLTQIEGISFDPDFYNKHTMEQMARKYVPRDIEIVTGVPNLGWRAIPAGKATLWVAS